MHDLRTFIEDVPDFPEKGVIFKDITPLLSSPSALALSVELMANPFRGKQIDFVTGAESRGFIFGTAVAQTLSVGFVPLRKAGKLPRLHHSVEYGLEYGVDCLQMHVDAVTKGHRVLIVDDLLATGGTMRASMDLLDRVGASIVGASVLIELTGMGGRRRLSGVDVNAVIQY